MANESWKPERRVLKGDLDQDVRDELAFHLEQRQQEYADRGLEPSAAHAAARRRFGNVEEIATACRGIDEARERNERRASLLIDLRYDLIYAVRSLKASPSFTLVALLTLMLGIGANTAIFSVINAVMLRPLPFRDEGRLVFLWSTSPSTSRDGLTPGRLKDFRERFTLTEGIAGLSQLTMNLTGSGDPERLAGSSVSSNFFDVLGVAPLLGDTFHAGRADDRDVVLSYGLWMRRFAADRGIVGRDVTINGTARRVVAVMPAAFSWPSITARGSSSGPLPELWVPGTHEDIPRTMNEDPNERLAASRQMAYLRAVVRLKPGVTIAQAQQEADALAAAIARDHREDTGYGAMLQPLREQFFGDVRKPLLVLLVAVAFVLAIACANAASLLLGRAVARHKEMAIRLALGATRGRIVRQLVTESIVLALGGAAGGLLLAWWGRAWLIASAPGGILRVEQTALDARVLGFTILVAIVTGVLFGLVPARQVTGGRVSSDLSEGSGRGTAGRRAGRTRDLLVAAQIGVALVLLVGAGLLLRSFSALSHVDTGIDTRNLLTFELVLNRKDDPDRQVAFYRDALQKIAALPGVRSAGAAVTLPIGGDAFGIPIEVEGQPRPQQGQEPRMGYQVVTPAYFATMGMRIREGRDIRESDTADQARVILVNETMARQVWHDGSPLGRRVRVAGIDSAAWMTVVGVVADIRHLGPANPPRPELYQPVMQRPFSFMTFVVRTSGDPYTLTGPIRAAIASIDPIQPVSGLRTMDEHVARALSRPRFLSTLVAGFGGLALALSIVGIYGVMAYSVAQRTREIAIRAALGASRAHVLGMILTKALWLSLAGVAGGLAAAAWLTRALTGLLFGVTATDPGTYVIVSALLVLVALVAGGVPAVRALRIDGAVALRQ
jgi:putative ABC transport system permease protein